MSLLRLRLTGSPDSTRELINALVSIDGVERVEQIGDLMPSLDDEDSSSAGLRSDLGSSSDLIEVDASDATVVSRVRDVAAAVARQAGAALEIEDDAPWGDQADDEGETPPADTRR